MTLSTRHFRKLSPKCTKQFEKSIGSRGVKQFIIFKSATLWLFLSDDQEPHWLQANGLGFGIIQNHALHRLRSSDRLMQYQDHVIVWSIIIQNCYYRNIYVWYNAQFNFRMKHLILYQRLSAPLHAIVQNPIFILFRVFNFLLCLQGKSYFWKQIMKRHVKHFRADPYLPKVIIVIIF